MKKTNGFTLLELVITVGILGIIGSLALSFNNSLVQNNRAEAFLLELKRTISFARAKATTSDEIVITCAVSPTRLASRSNMNCRSNWSRNNIIVFIDADNSGAFNGNRDTLLRAMDLVQSTDELTFSGAQSIRFDSSGRVTSNVGSFIYCPDNTNENNKTLRLAVSGSAFYAGDSSLGCS